MDQREKNWNKRYLEQDYPWEEKIPSQELESLLKSYASHDSKILEVGCGLGTNALHMANLGYEITATDLSEESIRLAKARLTQTDNPQFAQLDFINQKLENKYDIFFERGFLHSFFNQESLNIFAQLASQALNDNGIWITISGNADNPDNLEERKKNNFPRLSLRNISNAVEPYFEILEIKRGKFGEINGFLSWVGVFRRRTYFYESCN